MAVTRAARPGLSAAFFDMDRTLVRKNTAQLYLRWRRDRGETTRRQALRVASWIVQYHLGVVDAVAVTRKALRSLCGVEEDAFRAECALWYRERVRAHVSQDARREVERRRREGAVCAILTASTPYVTAPLAEDLGIEHVLCTRLAVSDGRFTGRWLEPLCYGEGKVRVSERWAEDVGVDLGLSSFYTDSVSDLPMLERVGEPRVINPDARLRFAAARRRWRVERWK